VAKLQELLSGRKGELLVTPYVRNSPVFDQVLDRYGTLITRAFMLGHLKWSEKETEADSTIIYWTLRTMEKLDALPSLTRDCEKEVELSEIIKTVNGQVFQESLKAIRSGEVGNKENLLISLLMS